MVSPEQPETSKDVEDGYVYLDPDKQKERPSCISCGDPVRMVNHTGKMMLARHCRECYAELFHGKIPRLRGNRIL